MGPQAPPTRAPRPLPAEGQSTPRVGPSRGLRGQAPHRTKVAHFCSATWPGFPPPLTPISWCRSPPMASRPGPRTSWTESVSSESCWAAPPSTGAGGGERCLQGPQFSAAQKAGGAASPNSRRRRRRAAGRRRAERRQPVLHSALDSISESAEDLSMQYVEGSSPFHGAPKEGGRYLPFPRPLPRLDERPRRRRTTRHGPCYRRPGNDGCGARRKVESFRGFKGLENASAAPEMISRHRGNGCQGSDCRSYGSDFLFFRFFPTQQ